jgi:hypothetical protein
MAKIKLIRLRTREGILFSQLRNEVATRLFNELMCNYNLKEVKKSSTSNADKVFEVTEDVKLFQGKNNDMFLWEGTILAVEFAYCWG